MNKRTEIKVCGIRDGAFAKCVAECAGRADCAAVAYAGFILSPGFIRSVTPEEASIASAPLSHSSAPVRKVGVFTEGAAGEIADAARIAGMDCIQLHGCFGAEIAAELKSAGFEVWALDGTPAAEAADVVLVDGRTADKPDEDGRKADWSRVGQLRAAGRRVALAGGIGLDSVANAFATCADIIDIGSSLESGPGNKDPDKLFALMTKIKTITSKGI